MFGDAEAYERFMGRWSRLVAPWLVDFSDVPDTGRMLDVGSGTGSLAHAIVERKVHARVVDRSVPRIHRLRTEQNVVPGSRLL